MSKKIIAVSNLLCNRLVGTLMARISMIITLQSMYDFKDVFTLKCTVDIAVMIALLTILL